jgi:endonuclease-8
MRNMQKALHAMAKSDATVYHRCMEGPSLYLAARQLKPFIRKDILGVSGNSTIGIDRLDNATVKDIFSWGKHLVFQFDTFALRVHFMLFGSFEAMVGNKPVTGDYKKKDRVPRLKLVFNNGHIEMYSCSLKYVELKNAKKSYGFTVDVMSDAWDPTQALKKTRAYPNEQVADVLLDQELFAGVGNIIKNEILFMCRIHPESLVKDIPPRRLIQLVALARDFSFQFYEWRKEFVLRKHLVIYRKSICPECGDKVIRRQTGRRKRWSCYCEKTQQLHTQKV